MAKKVQQEDILRMVELYDQIGTYAGVAREVGFSASTVRKYVVEYLLEREMFETTEHLKVDIDNVKSIEEVAENWNFKSDWGDLCVLSEEELSEVKELWRELKK